MMLTRFIFCSVVAISFVPCFAAEFYMAPNAKGGNGTRAKPFGTLEAARDAVRAHARRGREPMTVWLAAGDYERDKLLDLTAQDSGSVKAPVVWQASPGAVVRWLGGRRIPHFEPVTDSAILQRIPQPARSNVVQANLRSLGVLEFPGLQSRGFARATTPSHVELFYDGKPMTLARWPNEGAWELIAGFPDATATSDGHGGKIGKLDAGFNYAGDRPAGWRDITNVWAHGYWAWDWANSYERLAALDTSSKLIKTAPPYGHYGFRKGQRIYFLNILEELDQPGEWFLDRASGILYFWPPGKRTGQSAEALVSVMGEPLLRMSNATNIHVNGIGFEASRGNGIEINGGMSNVVAGCVLRNLGNYGVKINGGLDSKVLSCDIAATGDGGVSLDGGDRRTLTPAGHVVENSHFREQGRWSKCYVPAVLIGGVGMSVIRNLIQEHPHCAILYTGNDHVMEGNEIHHIALETGDVGAIYTGRDYTYRGNKIRNNYIHHTGGVGMGSMGAYMDDCVSGTEISGNIFYKVQRAAFIGGGSDHDVVNNIFVECKPAVAVDGRGLDPSGSWRPMVDQFMRQRLKEVPLHLYRERYPAMKSLDTWYGPPEGPAKQGEAFKGVPPENNTIQRNVCVGEWLQVHWHATTNMLTIGDNFTSGDPRFVGPINDDAAAAAFNLKPDSPAWGTGFKAIPIHRIGLYQDRWRKNLR